MNILEILNSGESVFIEDSVESAKIKKLIATIKKNMEDMVSTANFFAEYSQSQLNGDVNKKIVMAKSLRNYYPNWNALKLAYDNVAKEEQINIEKYNATKLILLNSLQDLLKESAKEPIVSQYDLFDGDFVKCQSGHEIIILGSHNSTVIETMIKNLNEALFVTGHFNEIEAQEITANYSNVQRNVSICRERAIEIYSNKPNKQAKIETLISTMEEVGKKVVFFETCKEGFILVGCAPKAISDYEKSFEKQYLPLKKTLQKELRFEFVDICDLVADEDSYQEADVENPENIDDVIKEMTAVESEIADIPEEVAEEDVVIDTNIDDIDA